VESLPLLTCFNGTLFAQTGQAMVTLLDAIVAAP
jgi:hypothetical protein